MCSYNNDLAETLGEVYKDLKKYMIDCYWTGRILGKGSFGTVLEMKSKFSSEFYAGKQYHDIPRSRQQFISRLCGELLIMMTINHPNIVQTVGITFDDEQSPIVLMECMKTTLQEYILDQDVFPTLSLAHRAKLLCDVANGLNYLHHRRPITIHRDLTATNVLLDFTLTLAKLSDFGNARLVDLASSNSTPISSQAGTMPYMPPEVNDGDSGCDASFDVFSFGHLMLFVITGEIPALLGATYVNENGTIQGRSEVDRRSKFMIKSQKQLGRNHVLNLLMERCLHNLPGKRPPTQDLVKTLEHVVHRNRV